MIAKNYHHPENILVRKGVSLSEVRATIFDTKCHCDRKEKSFLNKLCEHRVKKNAEKYLRYF